MSTRRTVQTPEERELEKKRAELVELQGELADRELELITLQDQLHAFEAQYFRVVGRLYAELDELHARVAEQRSRREPQNGDLHRDASEARTRASQSAEAVGDALVKQVGVRESPPADELKRLYREIAKQLHPDLTTDPRERDRRTRLMADANRAYAAGDETKLRAILDEWVSSPDSVPGEGVAAELVRTIRKIHQGQRRLSDIATELAALRGSDLFTLFQRVESSQAQGRDLLAEMANELRREIAAAQIELGHLSSDGAMI